MKEAEALGLASAPLKQFATNYVTHAQMNEEAFRRHGHELVDWIADYLEHSERYPVLARVKPGEIASAFPATPRRIPSRSTRSWPTSSACSCPGLTHWNHPRFFAYFAISASPPGVLADFLSAALNQQAMLWRTSPAATELEVRRARLAAASARAA